MIRSMAAIRAIGRRICLLRQPTKVSAASRTVAEAAELTRSMVMKYRFLILVSLGALIFVTSGGRPTFAHHSASATYIHGELVKSEGTLKEFLWRDWHSVMKVQASVRER